VKPSLGKVAQDRKNEDGSEHQRTSKPMKTFMKTEPSHRQGKTTLKQQVPGGTSPPEQK
jgi:hypothetical protein